MGKHNGGGYGKGSNESGAVAGLWTFLGHMPMGVVLIPIVMLTLIISFATAADDAMTTTIASLCTQDSTNDHEPPTWQKIL